jgi:hypothetical protein
MQQDSCSPSSSVSSHGVGNSNKDVSNTAPIVPSSKVSLNKPAPAPSSEAVFACSNSSSDSSHHVANSNKDVLKTAPIVPSSNVSSNKPAPAPSSEAVFAGSNSSSVSSHNVLNSNKDISNSVPSVPSSKVSSNKPATASLSEAAFVPNPHSSLSYNDTSKCTKVDEMFSPPSVQRCAKLRVFDGARKRDQLLDSSTTSNEVDDDTQVSSNTALKQSTTALANVVCTPKRPKIVNLDDVMTSKLQSIHSSEGAHSFSTCASSSSCSQSFLEKISNVIPYPIKPYSQPDINVVIECFMDIVDLSSHSCCGFNYIFRLVDPISRRGHALVIKSMASDEVLSAFNRLMSIIRTKPSTIFYAEEFCYLSDLSSKYPLVNFVEKGHTEPMLNECKLFGRQLKRWMDHNSNWVSGVTTIQAVTNTLPISLISGNN